MSIHSSTSSQDVPLYLDVLVVGANAVGLTLSIDLARNGINYMIIDSKPGSEEKNNLISSCPLQFINSRSLGIFKDLGVESQIISAGRIIRGVEVFFNNTKIYATEFPDYDHIGGSPPSIIIKKDHLENILNQRLSEFGGKVHRPIAIWRVNCPEGLFKPSQAEHDVDNLELSDSYKILGKFFEHDSLMGRSEISSSEMSYTSKTLSQSFSYSLTDESLKDETNSTTAGEMIAVQGEKLKYPKYLVAELKLLEQPKKKSHRVENEFCSAKAKYIVGTDGPQSLIRKSAEIHLEKSNKSIQMAEAMVNGIWSDIYNNSRVQLISTTLGFIQRYPLSENVSYFVFSLENPNDSVNKLPQTFQEQDIKSVLVENLPNCSILDIYWFRNMLVEPKFASSLSKGALIIAGETAHSFYPTFNYSLNLGLQEVHNLGWKLSSVINNKSNISLLKTYQLERAPFTRHNPLDYFLNVISETGHSIVPNHLACSVIKTFCMLFGNFNCVSNKFIKNIMMEGLNYHKYSDFIASSRLGSSYITTGRVLPDTLLGEIEINSHNTKISSIKHKALSNFTRGGSHTLLLLMCLSKPGTKAKNFLGCDLDKFSDLWCSITLEQLRSLARMLSEIYSVGSQSNNKIRVVYVLCGIGNQSDTTYDSMEHSVNSFESIKKSIPIKLIKSIIKNNIKSKTRILIDSDSQFIRLSGIELKRPLNPYDSSKSGCYILIRPDGIISHNGYANDSIAVGQVISYARKYFS